MRSFVLFEQDPFEVDDVAIFREPLEVKKLGPLCEALRCGKVSAIVLMRLLHEILLLGTFQNDARDTVSSEASNDAGEQQSDIESNLMKARMPYVNNS